MRVVQFGVGGFGKNHVRILDKLGVLTAVCDPSKEALKIVPKGIFRHDTIESVLKEENFDTAFVCTPIKTHYSIALALLEAGKNVFVEKPLTYTSHEGAILIKLAKEKKLVLGCGYIERFNPVIKKLKEIHSNVKEYGNLIMIEFHRESKLPLHLKDTGIIYDTCVHDIDTANWLFKELPKSVFAKSGKIRHIHEDFATIVLSYSNNRVAVITSNWITPNKVRNFNAVYEKAIISGDFLTQRVEISKHNKTEIPRLEYEEPLFNEIKNFLLAVENKTELIVKPEQAHDVTRIAEACVESSKTGKIIEID